MRHYQTPFSIINPLTQQFNLEHGFLPAEDPLIELPPECILWEACAQELPKILTTPELQHWVQQLPDFPLAALQTQAQFERAMMLLSYIGQAYVWTSSPTVDRIPAVLAVPWHTVATQVGRPPILSYASYALYNWQRFDATKPIELGNIALLQNFLGGLDEEWFILVHVDIEARASNGLNAIISLLEAIQQNNVENTLFYFQMIFNSLQAMCETLRRMPEHCDPYIYYNRVRPYIHGWHNNPALPNGIIYEDVDAYQGEPQFFKGETGAQSSIIPAFDLVFGIDHSDNPLKAHLNEMRIYMPPEHQAFLSALEKQNITREFVKRNTTFSKLKDLYNECVKLIFEFRKIHLAYAINYIQKQHETSLANPTSVGTGGTPFIQYLGKHLQETDKYLI